MVGVFFHWLPLAGTIVLMSGLVYVAVQHNYRSSFNDPQIQIAEDVAAGLSAGRPLGQLSSETDIKKSLAAYVIIYNDKGEPLSSSGLLDGKIPKPPEGVFQFIRRNGEDRITWEPQPGVRTAIVITSYSNNSSSGFALAGRNMRELEKRERDLEIKVCFGLMAALIISFTLDFVSDIWCRKSMAV